jgi:RimJ/RimL family protein N-acetyltransferase
MLPVPDPPLSDGVVTEPGNEASQRVGERCGFRFEGVLRSYEEKDGQRVDNVVFSLLPGELT